MNTYKSTDNIQLSAHFNSKEFRCKCNKPHDFKISDKLISKLEELFNTLNCSKIIVNSGYRCPEHDKAVGGNGSGQHTKGTAADIVCYDKNGKIISAQKVTCAAQDIDFAGIANISAKHQAVHVDVRTSGTYKGDETKGTSSVTKDFYGYWGLNKDDIYGVKYTEHTVKRGESLWSIAAKYLGSGKLYPEIKSLNGMTKDTIYVGQVLKIPKK